MYSKLSFLWNPFIPTNVYICIHLCESKMVRKNVTLSIDEEVYEKYKQYCDDNAIALSKSIEIIMKEQIKEKK